MARKEKYIVEDEDGIVIYDETDDQEVEDNDDTFDNKQEESGIQTTAEEGFALTYVEGVAMTGIVKDNDGYRLKTNEEIFTDEYMRNYDRYMTAKLKKMKRNDHIVSAGVILFCITIIVFFIWIAGINVW